MKKLIYIAGLILITLGALVGRLDARPLLGQGMVEPVAPGTTLYYIDKAIQGGTGTGRLVKDQFIFLYATRPDKTAIFSILDTANGRPIVDFVRFARGQGSISCCKTFGELHEFLIDNGWKAATPRAVQDALRVNSLTPLAWLEMMASQTMVTFAFTPAAGLQVYYLESVFGQEIEG